MFGLGGTQNRGRQGSLSTLVFPCALLRVYFIKEAKVMTRNQTKQRYLGKEQVQKTSKNQSAYTASDPCCYPGSCEAEDGVQGLLSQQPGDSSCSTLAVAGFRHDVQNAWCNHTLGGALS